MNGSGLYTIDGFDYKNTFGYLVKSGSDDLLQLPKSKEVYSFDWKGQNGKQYDLTKRFFEDKTITFSGHIIADDEADFWSKYLALWNLLKSPGSRTIYSFELKQTFSAFYLESPNPKRFTRLVDHPGKIAMKLDIQFQVMFMQFQPPTTGPLPPLVNAGGNRTIILPNSSLTVSGASVTPRSGSTITYRFWEAVTYPSFPTITNSDTLTPSISGLTVAGSYVFKLTGEDSNGLTSSNNMTITVLPEGSTPTGFPYTFPYNLS